MGEFWQWMREKDYGELSDDGLFIGFDGWVYCIPFCNKTKQMLVGYMLEYLQQKGKFDKVRKFFHNADLSCSIYDQLEMIIKLMN